MLKLSIIVPVFNEHETILEILERIQDAHIGDGWAKEIIIVDNCSTDGTKDLLENYNAENVQVILKSENRGKGHSVRMAIPLCTGLYTITQDADLEYNPADYFKLLDHVLRYDLDVVYGSRVLGGKYYHYYRLNYWVVRGLTLLTNLFFGSKFTDVATNYKLVNTKLLQSLKLTCSGFDLDFEISNKLALSTDRIDEVPISYVPRTYANGKKIGAIDGLGALWVIVRDRLFSNFYG